MSYRYRKTLSIWLSEALTVSLQISPGAENPRASWVVYVGNVSVGVFPPQGAEC